MFLSRVKSPTGQFLSSRNGASSALDCLNNSQNSQIYADSNPRARLARAHTRAQNTHPNTYCNTGTIPLGCTLL
eukprot:CAMPEP_0174578200 /NCGR_PEP_ID=MMETSP0929-20130131/613_1 /TAXON_ID=548131 ORGANISM="Ostreococcus mediterraneus, Strain clade-D-RCC2572" /NCGR_SAMPLE_ID=MMETSP0929 /ASSEMBLY_ACC=CAM_ASM_000573 /LENGTH=73 /DNA_ID=CAMNT_0015759227 /DNA_START=36 /DNA_END=253 /DNA_ORIENTATION=+